MAQLVKNPPTMRETLGLIPGLGRSPGEGKGYPLQYSGLENSTGCIVHGFTKTQTGLSDFHSLHIYIFVYIHKYMLSNTFSVTTYNYRNKLDIIINEFVRKFQ